MTASKDHRPRCHLNYSWKEAAQLPAPNTCGILRARPGRERHHTGSNRKLGSGTRRSQGERQPETAKQVSQPLLQGLWAPGGTEAARSGGLGQVIFPKLFSVIAENSTQLRG